MFRTLALLLSVVLVAPTITSAQELGGAGTAQGTVKDPTGGVMQAVEVRISNPVSGFSRATTTDAAGKYVFRNLPPNPYPLPLRHKASSRSNATSPSAPPCRSMWT